ncbi:hypothetical protein GGR53DRAFT_463532 [Hypoxylon sp. FL1150]|nr:hypothetical protein GGR53DRAFT_463532 [Hypoxylon sp. FL1150]
MADSKRSPTPEHLTPEDPDTAAARKELRQTVISEKPDLSTMSAAETHPAPNAITGSDKPSSKGATPDRASPSSQNDNLRDQVSSPKKKRARDEVDEPQGTSPDANGDVSPIGFDAGTSLNRTVRSEPEKKRPRDVSSESKVNLDGSAVPSKSSDTPKTGDKSEQTSVEATAKSEKNTAPEKQKAATTSASAFSSSGIAGFATQASPFLKAAGKPLTSFASPSGSQSPFGTTAAKSTTPIFGSGLSNGTSPFGQVGGASKSFGGSAFGSTLGGTKSFSGSSFGGSALSTFGQPGESFKSSKPAKPFGAPAAEEEDDQEGGSSDDEDKAENEENLTQEEKTPGADDLKKKPKLQRIDVDDGEAGEATILQVRTKIYYLDKATSSWKERGAGNLKINVPVACVDFDETTGAPMSGTFDGSALEDAESKVVRLIMRQDSTHRVILNTALIPAMQFQEKSTTKATCVLFTAIEDEGAVSIQLKMNAANAKSFLNEDTTGTVPARNIDSESHHVNADVVATEARREAYLSDGSLDDLPDYEDYEVDAEITVAGHKKFKWGAVDYVSDDENEHYYDETVNEARNTGLTYAECIHKSPTKRRATADKPALPVEPDNYEANNEKSDSAVAREELTTGAETDDLSDHESDMNFDGVNNNIKREESIGENRDGILGHAHDTEHANMQEYNSQSSNVAPMAQNLSQSSLSASNTFITNKGVFGTAFIDNIFISNTAIREISFGSKAAITSSVVAFNNGDSLIKVANIKEAIIERAMIKSGAVVLQGCVFKNVTIENIALDDAAVLEHARFEEMAVEKVVMVKDWSSVRADSTCRSPESEEYSDFGHSRSSSSSSHSLPASPAKRKATEAEDPTTPAKKRAHMPSSSPNERASKY